MTLIQPDRLNALWNRILIGCTVVLLFLSVYLVSLYTRLVNLEHTVAQAEQELIDIRTGSSELKDRIFALFSDEELAGFAAAHHLVLEREPQYLTYSQ